MQVGPRRVDPTVELAMLQYAGFVYRREFVHRAITLDFTRQLETARPLHAGMLRAGVVRLGPYDAAPALADPDPVVRFAALSAWPSGEPVPEGTRQALLADPVESVRLLAVERLAR